MTELPTRQVLIFGDETYPDGTDMGRIVYVALGVTRSVFVDLRNDIKRLAGLGARRQEAETRRFLDRGAFRVVVGSIDRTRVYGRDLKAMDPDSELGEISRADSLWTYGFGFSVAVILADLTDLRFSYRVSVHYDERTLKPQHTRSMEKSLQTVLEESASQFSGVTMSLSVAQVPKPRGRTHSLASDGVWLADAVTSIVKRHGEVDLGPEHSYRDFTDSASELQALLGRPVQVTAL